MPKDDWGKARSRDVAKRARREYTASGGRSTYSYVWSDNDPSPPITKRNRKGKQDKRGASAATAKMSRTPREQPTEVVRRMVMISRKLWNKQGQLRGKARGITGMGADVTKLPNGRWTWSVGDGAARGEAASVVEAVSRLLRRFSRENPVSAHSRLWLGSGCLLEPDACTEPGHVMLVLSVQSHSPGQAVEQGCSIG